MINGKLGTTKLIAVNTKKILIYSGTIKLFLIIVTPLGIHD